MAFLLFINIMSSFEILENLETTKLRLRWGIIVYESDQRENETQKCLCRNTKIW
jgi:hypothetical protein